MVVAGCQRNDLLVPAVPLDAPASLTSISLDGAIDLSWSDNAYASDPGHFQWYRVYSTSYDLDHGLCGKTWSIEGTTVSAEFLVSALTNGVPRCFGVTAIGTDGSESLWSPLRQDTPRPDARNVLVWAYQADSTQSGLLATMPLIRFSPDKGTQRVRSIASTASLRSVLPPCALANGRSIARNHCGVLRKITGVFDRQLCGY